MTITANEVAPDPSEGRYGRRKPLVFSHPRALDRAIVSFVFGTTFLYLLPFFRFTSLNADEGIVLQGAQRILDGQVLYRDFFSFYTPGSYYWSALLLKLFGDSILVPRFALLLYGATLSSITYLLARRVCGVWTALFAAYLTCIITLPFSFYVQHNWESTVLAAVAVLFLVRLITKPLPKGWFVASFLIGLTVLFEQSKGGGLFLGSALGVYLLNRRGCLPVCRKSVIASLCGLAAPFVITALYFASQHALSTMLADWSWPLRHYSAVNKVPYGFFPLTQGHADVIRSTPVIWRAFIWLSMSPLILIPVLPFVAAGYVFFQSRNLRGTDLIRTHYVLVGSILVGLWLGILVSRRDAGHVIYLLPLFILPLAWIIEGRRLTSKLLSKIRPLIILWALLSFSFLGISMLFGTLNGRNILQTRRGNLRAGGTDSVFAYVQSHVRPGDRIFVYPYQPLYYYLTGASNPTAYEYFQPGMHSSQQIAEAVQQLDRDKTPVVLFTPSFSDIIYIPWPNTPLPIVAQQDPMAMYIVRNYRSCRSLASTANGDWIWLFMKRVGTPCPEGPQPNSASADRDQVR